MNKSDDCFENDKMIPMHKITATKLAAKYRIWFFLGIIKQKSSSQYMDCCYNDKCVGSLKKIIWLALEEWKLNSNIAKCIRRVKWLKKKYSLRFALPNNVQVLYGVVVHGGRFEPAWNVRFAQIVFPRNAILCQKIITRKKN